MKAPAIDRIDLADLSLEDLATLDHPVFTGAVHAALADEANVGAFQSALGAFNSAVVGAFNSAL